MTVAKDNGASLGGVYGIVNNPLAAWLMSRGQGEMLALRPDELRKPLQAPMCRAQREEQDKKWRWHKKPGLCGRPMLYRPNGWSCYQHAETQRQPLGVVLQEAPRELENEDGATVATKTLTMADLVALAGKTVEAEYSAPQMGQRPRWRYVVR